MALSDSDLAFLSGHRSAAMITIGRDGTPKVARVGVAVIDGKLWSSGTADRVRTRRLRRDPRCTVYVYGSGFEWLALETMVTILDGGDVPDLSVRLFREMQGQPSGPINWYGQELSEEQFRQQMVEEKRLIYEFEVHKSYGMG